MCNQNNWLQPSRKPRNRVLRWLWDKCHQQTVCAWCVPRRTVLKRAWGEPLETSHGICPECAAKQLDEAKIFNATERDIERAKAMMNFKPNPEQQAERARRMMNSTRP